VLKRVFAFVIARKLPLSGRLMRLFLWVGHNVFFFFGRWFCGRLSVARIVSNGFGCCRVQGCCAPSCACVAMAFYRCWLAEEVRRRVIVGESSGGINIHPSSKISALVVAAKSEYVSLSNYYPPTTPASTSPRL